jgi:hypothetical protein
MRCLHPDDSVRSTLRGYPIDGTHLDDAPMSDRARNLVKHTAFEFSPIEWLVTHTVDDLLNTRLVGVLTVLEVLTGLEALERRVLPSP